MKLLLLLSCLNLDLIVLADFSGSVDKHEQTICAGVNELMKIQDENFREALITFSDSAELEFGFSDPRKFDCIEATGTTNLLAALESAMNLFSSDFRDCDKVIVIISDGVPDNDKKCLELALGLRSLGIKVFGVLIDATGASESFMKQISDVYVSTDYDNLVKEIKKLSFCF